MARYLMGDGTVLDTDNSCRNWKETRSFNGNNHIGDWSGSQWSWATLYRSRKGRYYIVTTSNWQGRTPRCEWVSPEEAVRFLLKCELEVPEDLESLIESVTE